MLYIFFVDQLASLLIQGWCKCTCLLLTIPIDQVLNSCMNSSQSEGWSSQLVTKMYSYKILQPSCVAWVLESFWGLPAEHVNSKFWSHPHFWGPNLLTYLNRDELLKLLHVYNAFPDRIESRTWKRHTTDDEVNPETILKNKESKTTVFDSKARLNLLQTLEYMGLGMNFGRTVNSSAHMPPVSWRPSFRENRRIRD